MLKKIILAKVLLRLCQHSAAHTGEMQKTINRIIDEIAGVKEAQKPVLSQPQQQDNDNSEN